MLGAICGDIIGSYYETNCTKDYNFNLLHPNSHFTDDTVMNIAVCDAILYNDNNITIFNNSKRAKEYAYRYKLFYSRYPDAGFGQMFSNWARDFDLYKQKSYANGAAMRVIPIGYAYSTIEEVQKQTACSCIYTHNNKRAIIAAKAVSCCVYLAYHGFEKSEIKKYIERKFNYNLNYSINKLRNDYMFNSSADYSIPPAIISYLQSDCYEGSIRNAVSLGGDADTMACIAGGIAEAYYKEIPDKIKKYCLSKLDYKHKRYN